MTLLLLIKVMPFGSHVAHGAIRGALYEIARTQQQIMLVSFEIVHKVHTSRNSLKLDTLVHSVSGLADQKDPLVKQVYSPLIPRANPSSFEPSNQSEKCTCNEQRLFVHKPDSVLSVTKLSLTLNIGTRVRLSY